jgi:hypothetical protein
MELREPVALIKKKGEIQVTKIARMRVLMQRTGADRSVLARKFVVITNEQRD